MRYEVEQKFRVPGFGDVARRLAALGAQPLDLIHQSDCYLAHPAKDFRRTDEAYRVRSSGDRNYVTYKGPRVDQATKTREEIELSLPDGSDYREQYLALMEKLGFRRVAEVRKTRRRLTLTWEGDSLEVSLDDVAEVGTFVEIEAVADDSQLTVAQGRVQSLAAHLQLGAMERRSYLGLLQQARGAEQ